MMERRRSEWWWGAASAGQLAWGVRAVRRRDQIGNPNLMPLKAFAVASLFLGSLSCASFSLLHAAGIRQIKDAVDLGAAIRAHLRPPPPES